MGGWGELYQSFVLDFWNCFNYEKPLRTAWSLSFVSLFSYTCATTRYMERRTAGLEIHFFGGSKLLLPGARPVSKTNFVVAKLYVNFSLNENILIL